MMRDGALALFAYPASGTAWTGCVSAVVYTARGHCRRHRPNYEHAVKQDVHQSTDDVEEQEAHADRLKLTSLTLAVSL